MNACVRSEREILEEKLERLYQERREVIGNVERFLEICRQITAIELKFKIWDSRNKPLPRGIRTSIDTNIELLTINIR